MKEAVRNPSVIADICDGRLYKALVLPQSSVDTLSITLVLNTDGVAVFKSTNYSVWPILLMINELPFTERYTFYW